MVVLTAALVIGCDRVHRPPSTPTAAADARCRVDDSVIAGARQLRISEISDGHHGRWWFHVDLLGHGGGDFVGTVIATYQAHHTEPPRTATRQAEWPRAELTAYMAELQAALSTAPGSDDGTYVTDTSQSIYAAFDVVGEHGGLQLAADDGETDPMNWTLRGCALDLSHEHQRALSTRWRALLQRFGADALFTELAGVPPWPPRE